MSVSNTHYGAEKIGEMLRRCRSLFFIGIGGISMSALAVLSKKEGFLVGGSDRTESALTKDLVQRGIAVCLGHEAAHISPYDAIVYTVAISADNPEYVAAKQAGKPLISRSDYLGYLMSRFQKRIGVSGMHGKSTCTAMCADILLKAGDPTVLCGAQLPSLNNAPCRIGESRDCFLFEACEYMDSFLDFYPSIAVVLNIGMDHVDYFHSMEQIRASFLAYATKTGKNGITLFNADDAECQLTFAAYEGKKVTFAIDHEADFTAQKIEQKKGMLSFDFCQNGAVLCRLRLRASGKHNVYNALAAASAATLCDVSPDVIQKGLDAFRGAKRRMEYKGELACGAAVYDDYGHHPDEIRATLAGAKELGYERILCAYQPHTYSRTAGLLDEFSKAFADADQIFLADVYAAREQNVYGVTSRTLAERIGPDAVYCGGFDAVAEAIRKHAKQGDLVIIMGAGDVFHVFDRLDLKKE